MNNIEKKIKNIISEKLHIQLEKIHNDSSFQQDMNIDSLDKVEFIMALEEEFNIEITDEEAEKINTVQKSIDYIKKNINDKDNVSY
ncbi:acyl carrier protein [Buchnera aphidicola]|uniref:acyl carrier protein n=1 Tax=Buchnera aphidicola TaxID=9 RepID=UPI003BEEC2F1